MCTCVGWWCVCLFVRKDAHVWDVACLLVCYEDRCTCARVWVGGAFACL